VTKDLFNLICLLDLDAQTDGVDGWLNEDALGWGAGYDQGIEEDFLRAPAGCSMMSLKDTWR
jgi:hypothetical protein